MILGLSIFITLFTLSWVAYPLLFEYHRRRLPDALALEQEASLLRALKTHYESLDPEEEDPKSDDFKNIERRLMLRLARLYQRHELAPATAISSSVEEAIADGGSATPETESTGLAESHDEKALNCYSCQMLLQPDFLHCPACGVKL